MMITSLSHSQDPFPVGTISAIAILATKTWMQYVLENKDGNVNQDKEIESLYLFQSFNDNKLLSTSYTIEMDCFKNTEYVTG